MIQRIKNIFLLDGKAESKIAFLALVGPVFLLLSLFIYSFFTIANSYLLWAIALGGLIVCSRFKNKGLFVSFLVLFCFSFVNHFQGNPHHLWDLGLEISIVLGFFITTYSLDYVRSFVQSFQKNKEHLLHNISLLEHEIKDEEEYLLSKENSFKIEIEELKQELEEKNLELDCFNALTETLRKSAEQNLNDRQTLVSENLLKQKSINLLEIQLEEIKLDISLLKDEQALRNRNFELIDKLNSSQINYTQSKFINESLLIHLAKESEKVKQAEEQNKIFLEKLQSLEEKQTLIQGRLSEKNDEIKGLENKFEQKQSELANKNNELEEKAKRLALQFDLEEKLKTLLQEKKLLQEELLSQKAFFENAVKEKEKDLETLKNLQKKASEKNQLFQRNSIKSTEFKEIQDLYNHLRKQYADKNAILHEARSNCFELDEKLLALQKEKELETLDFKDEEKAYLTALFDAFENIELIEEENKTLQEIIKELSDKLISEQKIVKPRGKKKALNTIELPL